MMPLWWVYNDDGDLDNAVRATDEAEAMRLAVEGGTEEPTVVLVTAEEERAVIASERRERRAARRAIRALAEADVCDPPLSMMAWLSVATEHGYRCPYCGRFCKQSAFSAAPTVTRMAGAIVHHGPACKRCRGVA